MNKQLRQQMPTTGRLVVKSATMAGSEWLNHNPGRLVVKTATKAGTKYLNHNSGRLVVKTATKAGTRTQNHAARRLLLKAPVKAAVQELSLDQLALVNGGSGKRKHGEVQIAKEWDANTPMLP